MRASGYERAVNDWYVEDEKIVEALIGVEPFSGTLWDPACGGGNIPRVFERHGMRCPGSDIADRGYEPAAIHDFLEEPQNGIYRVADIIVCNPPYGLLEPWIDRCLERARHKVCILARLAFLEGQRRKALFKRWPLARVWVSSRRVSMPPGGTDIKAKGGTIAYAWFVFEPGHIGAPKLGWIE